MKKDVKNKETVETKVMRFLLENPDLFLSLREGVINISKLVQIIARSDGNLNPISVRSSLNHIKRGSGDEFRRSRADDILKKSRISLQDKICVVTSSTPQNIRYISATYLEDSLVYIVDEINNRIPPPSQGVKIERDVSMIHILSPKEIEKTPGFVMRITHRLFARDINIMQLISCSNETIIVLGKKDSTVAYQTLTGD